MSTNTVHVIQDLPGRDLTPAKEFGELNVILTGKESLSMAHVRLETAMNDLRPDDFILLCGAPISMVIAAHYALKKLNGRVNFLVWDRLHGRYNLEKITV